jgi:hypothetical protein
MLDFNFKDLIKNRERREFPEVVVPLESAPAPTKDDGFNTSLDRASSQENGSGAGPQKRSTLTLEALREEIDSSISASGHNTVYDRMFNSKFNLTTP